MSILTRETIENAERNLNELRVSFLRIYLAVTCVLALVFAVRNTNLGLVAVTAGIAVAVLSVLALYLLSRNQFYSVIANLGYGLALVGALLADYQPLIINLTVISMVVLPVFGNRWLYYFAVPALLLKGLSFDIPLQTANITPHIIVAALLSLMLYYFSIRLQRIASDSRRNADLLAASSAVGQIISQYLDLKPLLDKTVEVIRDRLGFYHVQVFLVNEENAYVDLIASTGEAGKKLLERKHRIAINSNSVIGRVVQAAEAVISREAGRDEGHAFNELLPDTRSELALPLVDGERVIGALDVQSLRADAFNRNDIQALQVIATQLATAIRNARLFEAQAQSVNENKRLFIEAEANLREIQRLNRQLTRQVWDSYTARTAAAAGVTLDESQFRPGAEWTPRMVQASQRRRPVSLSEGERHMIAVPIELRGEVIGALEVESSQGNLAPNELVEMLQAIASRLAVSIDSARLFEETQEATAQEQRISEIVSGYQSAQSVEDLLEITLEGLAEALGAERGAIRLGAIAADELSQGTRWLNAPERTPQDANAHQHNGQHTEGT